MPIKLTGAGKATASQVTVDNLAFSSLDPFTFTLTWNDAALFNFDNNAALNIYQKVNGVWKLLVEAATVVDGDNSIAIATNAYSIYPTAQIKLTPTDDGVNPAPGTASSIITVTPGTLSGLACAPLANWLIQTGNVWQDAAMTMPVTASGQTVEAFKDPVTGLVFTALASGSTIVNLGNDANGNPMWTLVGNQTSGNFNISSTSLLPTVAYAAAAFEWTGTDPGGGFPASNGLLCSTKESLYRGSGGDQRWRSFGGGVDGIFGSTITTDGVSGNPEFTPALLNYWHLSDGYCTPYTMTGPIGIFADQDGPYYWGGNLTGFVVCASKPADQSITNIRICLAATHP